MLKINLMFLVVFITFLGGAFLQESPSWAADKPGSSDTWTEFAQKHHCVFAMEDAYSTETGTYIGTLPAAPPQGFKTINAAVSFLRAKLPACTVWRDKLNSHIIHIVYTKALKWKANPLNQRLTFHGTMSLKQVTTQIIQKKFPHVTVACLGNVRAGVFISYIGLTPAEERAYDTPRRFDVKRMTLRQFLTTGVAYDIGGRQPPFVLWRADYYLKSGKPTGRVDIMVYGVPLRSAPPAKPAVPSGDVLLGTLAEVAGFKLNPGIVNRSVSYADGMLTITWP